MKLSQRVLLASCLALSLPALAEKKSKPVTPVESGRLYMEEGYKHEVLLNGSTQIVPLAAGTSGTMAFGGGTTIMGFSTGYNYGFSPYVQMGIFPSLTYLSASSTSVTIFGLLVGPTVNLALNGSIEDAFFLAGGLGFTDAGANTEFTFRFDLGKRFRLFDHISIRPSIGLLKISGSSLLFVFNPLGAAIHF